MSHLLCALLSLFSFAALLESAQWKLQENVFVIDSRWDAEAPATAVELSCNSPEEAVLWRKDSSPFQEGKQRGKTLRVAVKELPDGGNYSCVSQESLRVLSSSLLLIARIGPDGTILRDILKSFQEPKTFLKCEARNYSGVFTCSWMTENNPHVKFTIRSLEGECSSKGHPSLLEEKQLAESKTGPASVKPDPPQCQHVATNGTVTWTYPSTWSTPNSYFPLTFKVKVKSTRRHRYQELCCPQVYDTEQQSVQLPPGPAEVWVQARDRCYLSSWSSWSSLCR
ncbi:hypothetical protein EK904_000928 [Melospiza melodia maxima]|nr:hypothetical protein EK904_000928 [Melospiza melodia maxima]